MRIFNSEESTGPPLPTPPSSFSPADDVVLAWCRPIIVGISRLFLGSYFGEDDNAGGNRLTKTVNGTLTNYGPYDAQNRLTQEVTGPTTINYAYDKNGNQISRTLGATLENFSYDYQNRLKTYQKAVSGSATASYLYRVTPSGDRLARINLLATVDNEDWFMCDGQDVAADYQRTTSSTRYQAKRTYVNGRSIDSKVAQIESGSTETISYFLGDALGSVHELVDSTGIVTRRVLDTAWGEPLPGFTPLTTIGTRYEFTQRENDSESALLHYRARSYDPRTGRFAQKDPAPQSRLEAHYCYGDNNPVSRTDPLGLWSILRTGGDYAVAFPQKHLRDDLVSLAKQVKLDEAEASKWLRYYGRVRKSDKVPAAALVDSGQSHPITADELKSVGADEEIAYLVPNVAMNFDTLGGWSGFFFPGVDAHELGGASAAQVIDSVKATKVINKSTNERETLLAMMKESSSSGKLWAVAINGHGGTAIDMDQGLGSVLFSRAISYRLGQLKLYACCTAHPEWLAVVSKYGTGWAFEGEYNPGWTSSKRIQRITATSTPKDH